MDFWGLLNVIFVLLGFGFVIFFHELGHFLAAKWAGVRVDQFAVGFGRALLCWRKGLGLRVGTSAPEYRHLLETEPDRAAAISPTEYRLNWIPLGGYVKMHGQEDLVASEVAEDDSHYMNKTVGQRMVIISAGVVFNVILAAILFTILYFIGFASSAPVVGGVLPGGPADRAGLQVGDTILEINGRRPHDFKDVTLATALMRPTDQARFVIQPAGTALDDVAARRTVTIQPEQFEALGGLVGIGIEPSPRLEAVSTRFVRERDLAEVAERVLPDALAVRPGERVVAVNGRAVAPHDPRQRQPGDYRVFYDALQEAARTGEPVLLEVEDQQGARNEREVRPRFILAGEPSDFPFGGLLPLVRVDNLPDGSPNGPGSRRAQEGSDILLPGDVLLRLTVRGTGDTLDRPTFQQLTQWLTQAGAGGRAVDVVVLRDGEQVRLRDLAVVPLRGTGRYGLQFGPGLAVDELTVAGVAADSPAARAGVPAGARILAVAGQEVSNWYEVNALMREAVDDDAAETRPATIAVDVEHAGERQTFQMSLDADAARQVARAQFTHPLVFINSQQTPHQWLRQTRNPLEAMWWGVLETRKQIVDLYITLRRVTYDRTVAASNLTGPVGIVHFGGRIAQQGFDWTLWFLAMISANLAVVNFLPIPILDGGHMVFLASEKLTGKPPSPRVQVAALYAGLALLVGLVLFVTYNDIQRLIQMYM